MGTLVTALSEENRLSCRGLILASLDEKPIPIFHADDSLKADREVVLEAVWQDGDALEHADDSLKADREVVLEAAKSWDDAPPACRRHRTETSSHSSDRTTYHFKDLRIFLELDGRF